MNDSPAHTPLPALGRAGAHPPDVMSEAQVRSLLRAQGSTPAERRIVSIEED